MTLLEQMADEELREQEMYSNAVGYDLNDLDKLMNYQSSSEDEKESSKQKSKASNEIDNDIYNEIAACEDDVQSQSHVSSHLSLQDIDSNLLKNESQMVTPAKNNNGTLVCTAIQMDDEKKSSQLTFTKKIKPKTIGNKNKFEDSDDDPAKQKHKNLLKKIKKSRLNVDLNAIVQFFYSGRSLRNNFSDRFDEIEQEFICLNKFSPQILDQCGYTTTLKSDLQLPGINFRKIYENQDILCKIFGKSLKIEVQKFPKNLIQIKRHVYAIDSKIDFDELWNQQDKLQDSEIFDQLYHILLKYMKQYKSNVEDIVDIFIKVNGDLESMKSLLEGKRVTEWSGIEDLSLAKDIKSHEYQVLVQTKGITEIEKRKAFLSDQFAQSTF
ncbi:UNKNOWN [Stylonychia lemnae]|uniref:Uncharacterized protein n=1 Tax=Stylonychia lemnae TaxID=5949 RepID=A0A078AKZ1_STYLE|nr:UNKNOWN [Stylonychia lemnae]|eukprot:CDW82864.1 UNKNOWN [Stylonychia lemnae]